MGAVVCVPLGEGCRLSLVSAGEDRREPPVVDIRRRERAKPSRPLCNRSSCRSISDSQVPGGYVKSPGTFDASRRILLRASEIEKGMAEGKPTVSLATIYEQVPEIFLHTLPGGETAHVPLPYLKCLEQFNKVQVRSDQECEQAVPQVKTPILQVTIEDKDRFGTAMEPPQTSPLPPVKVEPATAKTISRAEPEPAVTEMLASAQATPHPIPLSTPVVETPQPTGPAEPAPGPIRIPFRIPPNGMGASASERVPASSGPPIPTDVPKKSTSARIPFRISPPSDDLRPKLTLVPGVEAAEKSPSAPARPGLPKADGVKIKLALQAIMQSLPAFQLNGSPETISAEARVEFPLSLVEPQLATGRVAIEAKTFQAALPEAYREIFIVDSSETPVLLPLQEVLKNLPSTALKMREDQEEIEAGGAFETPFSIKAKEDEKRFSASSAPISKTTEVATAPPTIETTPEETRADTPAIEKTEVADVKTPARLPRSIEAKIGTGSSETPAENTPGQKEALEQPASIPERESEASKEEEEMPAQPELPLDIKGRKEKNEAKEVLARANALPGVTGCCLTFADGLGLAGNLPAEAAADGLCAMAPSLLQRIERYVLDTKLGSVTAVTLHCAKSPVTFFMQGNICLTVLHGNGNLAYETQNELAKMTKELSRTYSQPEMTNVDH